MGGVAYLDVTAIQATNRNARAILECIYARQKAWQEWTSHPFADQSCGNSHTKINGVLNFFDLLQKAQHRVA
jgi:hypothetical protein